jgi:Circadian oscillating protein COP23
MKGIYLFRLLLILGCLCASATVARAVEPGTNGVTQPVQNSTPASSSVQNSDSTSPNGSNDILLEAPTEREAAVPIDDTPGDRANLTPDSPSNRNLTVAADLAPAPAPQSVAVTPPIADYTQPAAPPPIDNYVELAPEPPQPEIQSEPPLQYTEPPIDAAPTHVFTKAVKIEKVTFSCGEDGSVPATVMKVKDQTNLLVILWKSNFFKTAGYDAQTRCKQVSARFEAYNKDKSITYLTAGNLHGQSVVCLTSKKDGGCGDGISLSQGLLFTLKPNDDSKETVESLVAALQNHNNTPLEQ